MHEAEVIIRHYRKGDRDGVRDIAWDTAFLGEPASVFFSDKEVLADFLTQYFTDYEPESCFVAEADGRIIGYLIGAKNVAVLEKVSRYNLLKQLLRKAMIKGALFRKKNIIFIFNLLLSFLKGEFKMPDFYHNYPATLHINLDKDFRNLGIGSKLINQYLAYLTKEKIDGVYLPTMSKEGTAFFRKQGFDLLYEGKRSYFRYILGRDIPIYIYGKKLSA